MRNFTDSGIIIKIIPLKEADKLVIILSKNHGRLELVAKSAGKPLSRKGNNIDLLNLIDFSFYKSSGFDLLLEAKSVDEFVEVKRELHSIAQIFYLLEILNKLWIDNEDSAHAYEQLKELLLLLNKMPNKAALLILAYQLKLFSLLGFEPELKFCVSCHQELQAGQTKYLANYGFICKNHNHQDKQKKIDDLTIKVARFILTQSLEKAANLKVSDQTEKDLQIIVIYWLEQILDNKLKSANFVDNVKLLIK